MTTTYGWDGSHYDYSRGPMDIEAAVRDGIQFFTCKATEGTTGRDTYTGTSLARARSAGLEVMGAYHVVRTANIKAQVDNLLSYVGLVAPWWRDMPYWMWQCDLERWSYDNVDARYGVDFSHELYNRTSRTVFMYASKGQYGSELNNAGFPLWNANYGTNPRQHYREAYPGDDSSRWSRGSMDVLLQYGSLTTMGSQRSCDANAFRGSLDELKRIVAPNLHPDTTTNGEATMFLATPDNPIVQNSSPLYLCDGLMSRPISWADAATVVYCSTSGYGATFDLKRGDPAQNPTHTGSREWADLGPSRAVVRMGWGPNWAGPVGTPVTMTPADIDTIAAKTAAKIEVPDGMTETEVKDIINKTTLKVE